MVEIPANHRLTLEIPPEIPAGRGILTFTPAPDDDPFADLGAYLRANTPATIEEAKKEAAAKLADPNRKPFSRHFGALKGAFGDGMEYQRKLRDEWD
ncbi:hypothetical protein AGMMS49942_11810 [Spirochaetia bacterium]|nr:hypothetical protein AGMMS49942_11810 [Spirochaetia bacterium]